MARDCTLAIFYTGYEVEAVPMIGLEIPYVIEARLLNYEFIYGGTGQPSATLKIEPRALEEMNQVEGLLY